MKKLGRIVLVLLVATLLLAYWYWDSRPPTAILSSPGQLNKDSKIALVVQDEGGGLRSLEVAIVQQDLEKVVWQESYPRKHTPWSDSTSETRIELRPEKWLQEPGLKEGEFTVAVRVSDQPDLVFFSNQSEIKLPVVFDKTPPRIGVLSGQHYLKQGGSEAVLYQVFEECQSGAVVGDRQYRGFPVPARREGTHIALFALAHDQSPDTPVAVWAEDRAGNRTESRFWYKTFPSQFRKRQIQITDQFISRVAPEILSRSPEISEKENLLDTYLEINRELRRINNAKISEITQKSAPEPLWDQPFLQLSNSQVESVFADRRSYYYDQQEVDEQTHLGFDLASLAHSPVEASNSGVVVFADYLGIYGNCVILDHGLGLFSLYGHLSSVEVDLEQTVRRGQMLGRTGQTGLAGGDHLHFSMIIQGTQINPIEWWDEEWTRNHLLAKLNQSVE
jgi:murein DD-endopeptidase MepM/ murein hydrolase activator NlpD